MVSLEGESYEINEKDVGDVFGGWFGGFYDWLWKWSKKDREYNDL